MIFSRTSSGIANIGIFFGCDILVYTEGTENPVENNEHNFDERFYQSLFASIYPTKTVKIKCLGPKTAALAFAFKLEEITVNGSVVIVDRDGEDMFCGLLQKKSIIYTHGYSWENDFWTPIIAKEVFEHLACGNNSEQDLATQFRFVAKRLGLLSALDICSHINAEAVLPKNGRACGIKFQFSSLSVIQHRETRRLVQKYRNLESSASSVCRAILAVAMRTAPERKIQGHLWEYVILSLISCAIQKSGKKCPKLDHRSIKNVAMRRFRENCAVYLHPATIDYYRQELKFRFG